MPARELWMLTAAHLIANTMLLWLGYYWLGIGEASSSSLLWSAVIAVVLVCGACCAYGSALVFFEHQERCAIAAWRAALRNLLPLSLVAIALLALYYFLARWSDYSSTPALHLASYLTLKSQRPVKPATVLAIFNAVLWLVRWMILPVFCLPMIAAITSRGWQGFLSVGALARKWLYWIETPVLLFCAFAVPFKLLAWVPSVSGFGMETASFALRAAAAYFLFLAAWLLLAFATAGGKPRLTQAKTVASP